jgi:hypothetical protein
MIPNEVIEAFTYQPSHHTTSIDVIFHFFGTDLLFGFVTVNYPNNFIIFIKIVKFNVEALANIIPQQL